MDGNDYEIYDDDALQAVNQLSQESRNCNLNLNPGNPQNNKRYWNEEEDKKLTELVTEYGARNWKKIA